MNASAIIFYSIAAFILGTGLLAVTTRKIFRSAIWLLFSLIGIAALYFWMNVTFIAAVQIVVYVGGIVVLIIFSIFLTQRSGKKMPAPALKRNAFAILAALFGFAFSWNLIQGALPSDVSRGLPSDVFPKGTSDGSLKGSSDGSLKGSSTGSQVSDDPFGKTSETVPFMKTSETMTSETFADVSDIGEQMLSVTDHGYVLPFEVVSILLLAAMIGCIVIAMKTPVEKKPEGSPLTIKEPVTETQKEVVS
ncbi:NADH-quinone oxidoreductase subunit J [Flavihumibacter stibioxidans]|uniref:NADH-quinone oxidoreductase subunit J n=1 Tax=Flavihumibacter stibioxidans TaxID=1834163 RepID=A0ABR7M8G0_9BACT|nr:NADH-quinone oxidoreductase subunit J [Flavihumibacter stibioxidans]MBC6491257.1 hypothetical protein [Flavihumibacter stibioxidans]